MTDFDESNEKNILATENYYKHIIKNPTHYEYRTLKLCIDDSSSDEIINKILRTDVAIFIQHIYIFKRNIKELMFLPDLNALTIEKCNIQEYLQVNTYVSYLLFKDCKPIMKIKFDYIIDFLYLCNQTIHNFNVCEIQNLELEGKSNIIFEDCVKIQKITFNNYTGNTFKFNTKYLTEVIFIKKIPTFTSFEWMSNITQLTIKDIYKRVDIKIFGNLSKLNILRIDNCKDILSNKDLNCNIITL